MTCESEYWSAVERVSGRPFGDAERVALLSAEENADMTAVELGFEPWTERWFRVVMSGFEFNMTNQD